MKETFVHLHLHTDYSLLDGEGKVDEYVERAKELGMPAMTITDHGTMAGLVSGFDACEKAGIKFIAGCEFYVAPYGRKMEDKKFAKGEKAYNHLIVLAKNEEGYKNMCILMTRAWEYGYYRKPRIDLDLLKEHSEGLVVLSACVAGAVPSAIAEGDMEKAREIASAYKAIFGDDYYLEIQNHGLETERVIRKGSIELSKELGIKLVATNDCHYVRLEDKESHDWLLCMDTDKKVADKDRLRYEGNYHMTSEDEMLALFPECPEAVYNTAEVANKCNFRFTYGNYRMPKVHIPAEYGNDYFKYLSDETWKGFEKRYPEGSDERETAKKDVSYELGIIKEMGFAEYFLDTRKTVMEAKHRGYLVGPGRGSGAGSRVNYCLEITDIDPIPYNLLFERFLNPERVSMPDIDVDYDPKHKDEIIKFENDSNNGYFAKIRTFTTMAAKAVLKGCAKVSGIDDHVAVGNRFSKLIGNCKTMKEAWDSNPDLRTYVESSPELKKIWEISLKLEGTKKAASTHACGHIPTPVPCEQLFPCAVDSETGYLVCEYDMTQVEHLGNLKKDLLMLSNLTTISTARDIIKSTRGIDVPLWTQEILNDKDALSLIASGDTDGVFQLESDGMKSFMKDLKPDRFEDIIAGVALYRPGPMSFIDDYINGKQHPESIKYLTPELKPILEMTYGCIVYQEQVMQIVQRLAGFSMSRADIVRKAMGKKKMDIMQAERKRFVYGDESLKIPGCIKNGIPENIANTIYDQMIDFAKYAFNKSHAAAYAAISLETAYLKAHFPLEFAAGLLTSEIDDSDKLMKYIGSFKNNGVKVLPPDVQKSDVVFSIDNGSIRFGLLAVKSVGKEVAEKIVKERKEKPFKSYQDFIERTYDFISSDAVEKLAWAGALDFANLSRRAMAEQAKQTLSAVKKAMKKIDKAQMSLFDIFDMGSDEACQRDYGIKNMPEYTKGPLFAHEKEATGVYLSGHPLQPYRNFLKLIAVDSKYIAEKAQEKELVNIAGVMTDFAWKITKTGKQMVIISLEDESGTFDALYFPRETAPQPVFVIGDVLFLSGKATASGSIMVNDFRDYTQFPPRKLWFATNAKSTFTLEKQVRNFAKNVGGIGDAIYVCSKTTRSAYPLSITIDADEQTIIRAKGEFHDENVALQEAVQS